MDCIETQSNCHADCFPEGTTYFIQHLHCCGGAKKSLGNPIGTIIVYPAAKIPEDYLKCDGAAIEREAFAELFEIIGETYGAGDGATTFNLPDLRGEFIRGLDDGSGVDDGRVLGSKQDATQIYDWVGSLLNPDRLAMGFKNEDKVVSYAQTSSRQSTATLSNPYTGYGYSVRPRNVAMIYCIKAK